jgi:hypothetical protein
MKLYKVTYQTEVVILAEDESEALSNAQYYVGVGDEAPELMDLELVESMSQIPEWEGCVPYSAKRGYNTHGKRCEEFL